jgi:DNA-binding transcriptional ArsR family regulator
MWINSENAQKHIAKNYLQNYLCNMSNDNPALSHDPSRDIRLDPRNLKGLAHPLRVRLLGALREDGPATASMLAVRLGESSGATSYHLRQLEGFGFIAEEAGRGSGRERWWRAAHRSTYFDEGALIGDPDTALLGAEYLRAVAGACASRMLRWIEALPAAPEDWARAGTLSDWALRLTPEQARQLEAELKAVITRFPSFDPEELPVEGSAFVALQVQLLPKLPTQVP